jgi:hypothetical protein
MKNQWKKIIVEEELDVISRLEKGDQIVDMWRKVRFAYNSLRAICDNADRIIEGAKSAPKLLV